MKLQIEHSAQVSAIKILINHLGVELKDTNLALQTDYCIQKLHKYMLIGLGFCPRKLWAVYKNSRLNACIFQLPRIVISPKMVSMLSQRARCWVLVYPPATNQFLVQRRVIFFSSATFYWNLPNFMRILTECDQLFLPPIVSMRCAGGAWPLS